MHDCAGDQDTEELCGLVVGNYPHSLSTKIFYVLSVSKTCNPWNKTLWLSEIVRKNKDKISVLCSSHLGQHWLIKKQDYLFITYSPEALYAIVL